MFPRSEKNKRLSKLLKLNFNSSDIQIKLAYVTFQFDFHIVLDYLQESSLQSKMMIEM